jgi:hypothetical protein
MPKLNSRGTDSITGRGYEYLVSGATSPQKKGGSPKGAGPAKPKREYSNEKTGKRIVEWLSDPSTDRPRNRIRNLLHDLHDMARSWELVDDGDGGAFQLRENRVQTFLKIARRVSHLFRSYKFYPLVWPFGPGLIQQWAPITGPDGTFKKRWPPIAGEYTDNQAIYELTWLMANHDILRIRQCDCGRWLYARFRHQRFCSAKCRDKANKLTPKWREYRRKKAREYYWLHKNMNIR